MNRLGWNRGDVVNMIDMLRLFYLRFFILMKWVSEWVSEREMYTYSCFHCSFWQWRRVCVSKKSCGVIIFIALTTKALEASIDKLVKEMTRAVKIICFFSSFLLFHWSFHFPSSSSFFSSLCVCLVQFGFHSSPATYISLVPRETPATLYLMIFLFGGL